MNRIAHREVRIFPFVGCEKSYNLIFLISLLFAFGFCSIPALAPATEKEKKGEHLFEEKCLPCHTIGRGDGIGPDLSGVTGRRERDWLVQFIKSPGRMFDKGDPTAIGLLEKFKGIRMPDSGLTDAEIGSLLSYLEKEDITQPETAREPSPVEVKPHLQGDASIGLNLFTGAIPFGKGGAPCMACHSIAGAAVLGGGTLGPDLTETFEDYGREELISVLSSVPFPTMKPVYDDYPLLPREQAHLVAFMEGSVDQPMSSFAGGMSMLVAGILLAILALIWLLWRNRLREVRKTLVEESRKRRAK